MKHNVYNFNKTIYQGNVTLDFYIYCIKTHPKILVDFPITIVYFVLYLFGLTPPKMFKENFFRFLRHIESIDDLLVLFWNVHETKISDYYISECNENDIIISISPEFLLLPICQSLNIKNLIAPKVNKYTGIYDDKNYWEKDKLKRIKKQMPDILVNEFYSDSLSDTPIAEKAEKAYIVRKDKLILWSNYTPTITEKIISTYLSKKFLLFVFCGGIGTLTNFVCSLIISTKANSTLSYVLGYSISLFVTYALNARLIYKEKYRLDRYIKFVISYTPNFLILFAFVFVFLNMLHWNKVIVYALAGLLGLPVTYILVKIFAFSKRGGFK